MDKVYVYLEKEICQVYTRFSEVWCSISYLVYDGEAKRLANAAMM